MPRHRRLFKTSYRRSSSSALVGYIILFVLAISLIQILLPFMILAGIGWGIYKVWQYWHQQQQQISLNSKEQQDRLTSTLYKLIQQHQGRVSILDFAMTAKISSTEAKNFLDEKAKEFFADFEPTDLGEVLYVFNTLKNNNQAEMLNQAKIVEDPITEEPEPISFEELVILEESLLNKSISLNQADLASRLNLSSSSVGRKKFSPDFAQWSQARDPEGWAWYYDTDRKRFHPIR
jgi:hypothetical protein